MNDDYWDQMDDVYEENTNVEVRENEAAIIVNGGFVQIQPGLCFKDEVKRVAEEAGLGKFRVFLNGTSIKPSDAPELIQDGDKIELRPYDVAG